MSQIIKQDTSGNAFAVVKDIAEYCEVELKSAQRLILNNMDLFNEASSKLNERIGAISNRSVTIKFELVKSGKGNEVDWNKTKMFQPHVELLLMLMKNTDNVKKHKMELVVEFFANKVELLQLKAEQQERLVELEKANVEKLKDKIHVMEVNKFKKWEDGYNSVSRYIKENKLDVKSSEMIDMLCEEGVLERVQEVRHIVKVKNYDIAKKDINGTIIVHEDIMNELV